jgi:hypothetical protein
MVGTCRLPNQRDAKKLFPSNEPINSCTNMRPTTFQLIGDKVAPRAGDQLNNQVMSSSDSFMRPICIGAVSGCTAAFLTNPIDMAKTRLQLEGEL